MHVVNQPGDADDRAALELRMRELIRCHPTLQQPLVEHLDAGGQRVRARLTLSACQALGISHHDALCLACCCELLHNASLIHDDIQDQDVLRRGQSALWVRYGSALAICAGDQLLSAAYLALASLNDTTQIAPLLSVVHQRVTATIGGQAKELGSDVNQAISLGGYLQIAAGKCGGLFSLVLELPLRYRRDESAARRGHRAASAFAVAYQILDDLQDRQQDDKPASADLNLVHLLRQNGYPTTAPTRAQRLALGYLRRAARLADTLPLCCGLALSAKSNELAAPLQAMLAVRQDNCAYASR